MQRKLASQVSLVHTIRMDAMRTAMHLTEKGGPIDLDNTYTIGNDFQDSKILERTFRDKAYWMGDALVLHRVVVTGEFELVLTRTLSDEEGELVLKSVHRNLENMHETEATTWFVRTGPAGIAVPVPKPDAYNLAANNSNNVGT